MKRSAALLLSVLGAAAWAQPLPAPAVAVAEARNVFMAPTLWAPGTVVSRNDARIAAEVDGRITFIAEPGERFTQGDVIARLDDRSLRLTLAERDADIGQLEARLDYNNRQLERFTQLAEQNSAARTQLDEIRADRDAVRKQLASAVAARDRVAYDLERAVIRAPFSGQWVERHQQIGEYTRTGAPIGRLVDTSHKEIRARAPVSVAPFVEEGMLLTVKADARLGEFPVRVIIPVGDEISRSLELRVTLPPESPLVGTAVRVAVPTERAREVVAVPRDALVIRSELNYVQRVVNGAAVQTPVLLGIAQGELIAVSGEIRSGDKVVVRGAERLRDGQPVRVLPERAVPGDG